MVQIQSTFGPDRVIGVVTRSDVLQGEEWHELLNYIEKTLWEGMLEKDEEAPTLHLVSNTTLDRIGDLRDAIREWVTHFEQRRALHVARELLEQLESLVADRSAPLAVSMEGREQVLDRLGDLTTEVIREVPQLVDHALAKAEGMKGASTRKRQLKFQNELNSLLAARLDRVDGAMFLYSQGVASVVAQSGQDLGFKFKPWHAALPVAAVGTFAAGTAAGAASGAFLGSIVPGVGTVIGGALGGLASGGLAALTGLGVLGVASSFLINRDQVVDAVQEDLVSAARSWERAVELRLDHIQAINRLSEEHAKEWKRVEQAAAHLTELVISE
jgi:hypothetical protein